MKTIYAILRWPWTPWEDIMLFSYGGGYLLQGRRNRITGRAQFAVRKMGQWWRVNTQAPCPTMEQMKQAGMFGCSPDRVVGHVDVRFVQEP